MRFWNTLVRLSAHTYRAWALPVSVAKAGVMSSGLRTSKLDDVDAAAAVRSICRPPAQEPKKPGWSAPPSGGSAGTISRRSSGAWPTSSVLGRQAGDVASRPARQATRPRLTGSAASVKTIGMVEVACFAARRAGLRTTMTSTWRRTNSAAAPAVAPALRPAILDRHVAALDVADSLEASAKRGKAVRPIGDACRGTRSPAWPGLLRARRERPRGRRAAEQRDELAPSLIRSPRRRARAASAAPRGRAPSRS